MDYTYYYYKMELFFGLIFFIRISLVLSFYILSSYISLPIIFILTLLYYFVICRLSLNSILLDFCFFILFNLFLMPYSIISSQTPFLYFYFCHKTDIRAPIYQTISQHSSVYLKESYLFITTTL